MNVLFIEPPAFGPFGTLRILGSIGSLKADIRWPPYDLMILAGMARAQKHRAQIIDAQTRGMDLRAVKAAIASRNPDFVVFTTTPLTLREDARVAEAAKAASAAIRTVAVGLSMRAYPLNPLQETPALDYAAYADPEPILSQLLEGCPPETIPGIYRRGADLAVKNPPAQPAPDLDRFGIPAQDLIEHARYRDPLMRARPMTIVNCSRGCAGSCAHCLSVFQKPLRYRSVASVMEELRLCWRLGVREIKFFDCGLTNDPDWTRRLCEEMLRGGLCFSWNANSRCDRLSLPLLKLMKRAGCHTVAIGSESASNTVLREMNKGVTRDGIAKAVAEARKAGLRIMLYFTLGLKGETEETVKETISFAKRMNPDFATFGLAVPIPQTPFYDYLVSQGLLKNAGNASGDPDNIPAFSYPGLSAARLFALSREAYRSFYLRPSYILKKLLGATPRGLINDARNAVYLAKRILQ